MLPPQQPSNQAVSSALSSGPVMSVDEELMEEMNTLHLGYIETEDSPHKLEQREKLESEFCAEGRAYFQNSIVDNISLPNLCSLRDFLLLFKFD